MAIKRKKKGGGAGLKNPVKGGNLFSGLNITNERIIMGALLAIVGGVAAWQEFKPGNAAYREQQRLNNAEVAKANRGNERYKRKCTMLVRAPEEGEYEFQIVALSAGMRPADVVSGLALAPDAIVCDDKFNTAKVAQNGFLTDWARASDEELVNQRVADFIGWNAQKRRSAVGVVCTSQDCLAENQNQGE